MTYDIPQVFAFLRAINLNNTVEWMHANRKQYELARDTFYALSVDIMGQMAKIDPLLRGLDPRQCIFRFARDTRFSWDKRPYKTHFGLYLVPGGKKNVGGGYYFQLQPHNEDGEYAADSIVDVGVHCPPTAAAKVIRQAICDEGQQLRDAIENDEVRRYGYRFWSEERLKVLPKQWKDSPYDDLIRMKDWDLFRNFTEAEMLASDMVDRVVEGFRIGKPINDFFNRVLGF